MGRIYFLYIYYKLPLGELMQKSHFYLPILIILFGCQVYMDPRNEPLMLVTEEEWSELKTVKETNFEIEPDPVQPPPELPGSEKIGFIDATTARLYGCRALTKLKMMHEGPYDHGIIATKNRALTVSQFNVELYRCPDSAFEEDKISE